MSAPCCLGLRVFLVATAFPFLGWSWGRGWEREVYLVFCFTVVYAQLFLPLLLIVVLEFDIFVFSTFVAFYLFF